eukprot:g15279.t1
MPNCPICSKVTGSRNRDSCIYHFSLSSAGETGTSPRGQTVSRNTSQWAGQSRKELPIRGKLRRHTTQCLRNALSLSSFWPSCCQHSPCFALIERNF